jgi:hypothetical protein
MMGKETLRWIVSQRDAEIERLRSALREAKENMEMMKPALTSS